MTMFDGDGRAPGIIAAIGAVLLGLLYMELAGAPARLLLTNAAALGIGLALLFLARALAPAAAWLRGPLLIGFSVILLATAFGGVAVEGASRWLSIGGLSVQPGLIFAPLIVTAYASRPEGWSAAALATAIFAIALQPDRAVAAMLLCGVAAIAVRRFDRGTLALCVGAAVGLAWTLLRPDELPATAYVDQILYTSFEVHPVAALAVWTGICLLFVPLFTQLRRLPEPAVCALGALWGSAVVAAALGNYPTPLVGYGSSAIIGYLLALIPLASKETVLGASSAKVATDGDGERGHGLNFA